MTEEDILAGLFREHSGTGPESISALPSSGSHRRYFRIQGGGEAAIGVLGTDVRENRAFFTLAEHFLSKGINVPEVFRVSPDGMAYIQEDLGDTLLFDAVSEGRSTGNYSETERALLVKAVSCLPEIQYKGAQGLDFGVCYPSVAFDRMMVMFDLNYFKYCFLKPLGVAFSEVCLQKDLERLADDVMRVSSEAGTFMYRDFQARNVMMKNGTPYFIDFQGGMRGAPHYDLASFVWQARAGYPEELKQELISAYLRALPVYEQTDPEEFYGKLRLFVLIRTLQVLGAYGFRGYFERKPHFLESIPSAVQNIRELTAVPFADYPYLNEVLGGIPDMLSDGTADFIRNLASARCATTVRESSVRDSFVRESFVREKRELIVTVYSFSYRKGIPEDVSGNGGGSVFDCRALHNPGRYDQYKSLTGKDLPVIEFLENDGEVFGFLENAYRLADAHVRRFRERGFTSLMICFGCTGGQHRSVYCAESMARHLSGMDGVKVRLIHREQEISGTDSPLCSE